MKRLLVLLALAAFPVFAQTGPRGRAIKADQVLLDPEVSYEIITTNLLQGAIEDLDSAVATNAAAIAAAIAVLEAQELFSVTNSYTYDDGTLQNLYNLTVRNGLVLPDGSITSNMIADGSIGTNHLSQGTIDWISQAQTPEFDASVSFMGYPKLALTTNMLKLASAPGGESSTMITGSALLAVIDNDITTSSTGTVYGGVGDPFAFYGWDLGAVYSGVLTYRIAKEASVNDAMALIIRVVASETQLTTYDEIRELGYLELSGSSAVDVIVTRVHPFVGRYIGFSGFSNVSGSTLKHRWYDFSVYGVTNNYVNMQGGN